MPIVLTLYVLFLLVWLLVISRRLLHTMPTRGSYSSMLATECLRAQLMLARQVADYLCVDHVYVFDTTGFFDSASVHLTSSGLRYRSREGHVAVLSMAAQAILPMADPNVYQQIARCRLTNAAYGLCLETPRPESCSVTDAADRGRDEVDG
ncbi:ORF4 [Lake Sinai Virus NE]|uniref:ORF4 n=1 Tax=Lake Sinai Virus NE TaxID=1983561 RepID=UPI000A28FF05|nr:ORF4 [Lake Sinai Virus NE]ARO50060.1 ORF4 [Lake Sinai Virus NE]